MIFQNKLILSTSLALALPVLAEFTGFDQALSREIVRETQNPYRVLVENERNQERIESTRLYFVDPAFCLLGLSAGLIAGANIKSASKEEKYTPRTI